MEIIAKTEITLSFEELERLLKSQGFLAENLDLENIHHEEGERNIKLKFGNSRLVEIQKSHLEKEHETEKFLDTPIEDLDLSVRSLNCLKAADLKNMRDVADHTLGEFLKYRNFGKKGLTEIQELLKSHNLSFKPETSK